TNAAQQLPPPRRLWRLSKLKNEQIRDQYTDLFSTLIAPINTSMLSIINTMEATNTTATTVHQEIDKITNDFYSALYTSLDTSLGPTPGGYIRRTTLWTVELQRLWDHRELCYKKWRNGYGMNKLTWWVRHQEARAKLRRAIRSHSRGTWKDFCTSLENDDYSKTTARIKKIKQRRTILPTFSHPEGPTAAATAMASHLEKVYDG
ncbi:hypothetical protein BDA99DRAFT_422104, partial [Phascolomyces articulosus]